MKLKGSMGNQNIYSITVQTPYLVLLAPLFLGVFMVYSCTLKNYKEFAPAMEDLKAFGSSSQ